MAINGLTKNVGATQWGGVLGLPVLAHFRKGDPKGPQGQVGKDLDYFRVDIPPHYEELLRPIFIGLYGAKAREFSPVYLTGTTPDECMPNFMEQWNKSLTLVRRCDAVSILTDLDSEQHHVHHAEGEVPCIRACGQQCGCEPRAYLSFNLQELRVQSGLIGVVRLSLGSTKEIGEMYKYIQGIYDGIGHSPLYPLHSIPFRLFRYEVTENADMGNGKRGKIKRWYVRLEADPDYMRPIFEAAKKQKLELAGQGQVVELLPVYEGEAVQEPRKALPEPPAKPAAPKNPPKPSTPAKAPITITAHTTGLKAYAPDDLHKFIDSLWAGIMAQTDKDGNKVYSDADLIPEALAPAVQKDVSQTLNGFLAVAGISNRELDAMRHKLLGFLFGVESSKDFTPALYELFKQWGKGKRTSIAKGEVEQIVVSGRLSPQPAGIPEKPPSDFDEWMEAKKGGDA